MKKSLPRRCDASVSGPQDEAVERDAVAVSGGSFDAAHYVEYHRDSAVALAWDMRIVQRDFFRGERMAHNRRGVVFRP